MGMDSSSTAFGPIDHQSRIENMTDENENRADGCESRADENESSSSFDSAAVEAKCVQSNMVELQETAKVLCMENKQLHESVKYSWKSGRTGGRSRAVSSLGQTT